MLIVFGVVVAVIAVITAATVIRNVRAVRIGRVVAATADTCARDSQNIHARGSTPSDASAVLQNHRL